MAQAVPMSRPGVTSSEPHARIASAEASTHATDALGCRATFSALWRRSQFGPADMGGPVARSLGGRGRQSGIGTCGADTGQSLAVMGTPGLRSEPAPGSGLPSSLGLELGTRVSIWASKARDGCRTGRRRHGSAFPPRSPRPFVQAAAGRV